MKYLIPLTLLVALTAFGCGGDGGDEQNNEDTSDFFDTTDAEPEIPDDFEEPESVEVSDLFATVNPANTLSYYISWSTDADATTELSVTCGDDYDQLFSDEVPKQDHEVFVMGLYPGANCDVVAHPSLETTGEAQTSLEDVGNLPAQLPELTVNIVDEDRMQPGWTLFSLASASEPKDLIVVAIDPQGRYRWYYTPGPGMSGAGTEVSVVDNGLMLGSGAPHQQIVSWESQTLWKLDQNAHHDMRPSPWNDNHVIYLGFNPGGCGEHSAYEMNMETREIIWEWHICNHWEPRVEYGNWSHLNTIEPVPGERAVLISSRDQDAVYKVNRDTNEIEWTLGRDGDFQMAEEDWFYRQHAPEIQEDGTILILDNGVSEGEAGNTGLADGEFRDYTKVVQYELTFDGEGNPDAANVVWEYVTEDIFAVNRSEADRLENGNTLIHYVWVQPDETVILREITMDKEIVWDVETPPDASSYRNERFEPRFGYVIR